MRILCPLLSRWMPVTGQRKRSKRDARKSGSPAGDARPPETLPLYHLLLLFVRLSKIKATSRLVLRSQKLMPSAIIVKGNWQN